MDKTFIELVRQLLKDAHETFEGTMQGVTEEVAHWQPEGKALPIGAAYAHAVIAEDMLLNGMIKKSPMLVEQGWGEKMGLSEPHPANDENWEAGFAAWTKSVKVELPKLQEYAQAVYKQTDDYLAGLTDKDLINQKVDLSGWGMGEWALGRFVHRLLIGHIDNLCGEISAIKGLQGLKGYPF